MFCVSITFIKAHKYLATCYFVCPWRFTTCFTLEPAFVVSALRACDWSTPIQGAPAHSLYSAPWFIYFLYFNPGHWGCFLSFGGHCKRCYKKRAHSPWQARAGSAPLALPAGGWECRLPVLASAQGGCIPVFTCISRLPRGRACQCSILWMARLHPLSVSY